MLEHLNHPFLCNLRYSFQDLEYLYGEPACPVFNKPLMLLSTDTSSLTS